MYALKNKTDGKLMTVSPATSTVWHMYENTPEVTQYLLIAPQTPYSKTIFVTLDKGAAYGLAKNGQYDGMRLEMGSDVEVVKLKVKRAKHDGVPRDPSQST